MSILDKYNDRITTDLGEEYVNAAAHKFAADDPLEKYRKLREEKKVFQVAFASVDPDGTFSTVADNVKIVLSGEKFNELATSSNTYATSNLLGVSMQVTVCRIEEEGKKVYVELAGSTKASYLSNMRNEINNEIMRNINLNKHPIVWGRVIRVTKDKLMVDILDKGILGFMNKRHWGKDFIRSLESVCREGEFFQFEVIGRAPQMDGKPVAWILSRKNIANSAWDNLDIDGLKENGLLLVKCIEKPVGKTYWWGASDRLPGVEVMGDYSSKFPNERSLYVGITYKCKIKRLDKEGKKVSVKPFEVIPADVAKVENLRIALGKASREEQEG